MGYSFQGIFTNHQDQNIIDAARHRWPFCTVSRVDSPFNGIAIYRGEEKNPALFDQEFKDHRRLQDELGEFTLAFPEILFIHLWTDCHGGDCYYDGFVCMDNRILLDNRSKGPKSFSRIFERDKLRTLLRHFDVSLNGMAYFEPFERGYFESNIISKPESLSTSSSERKKPWWRFW